MLYNPAWEKPRPPVATWASLIAWLETKDPEETYCYFDHGSCLAAQYNKAMGRPYDLNWAFGSSLFSYWSFDRRMERLARNNVAKTFGAALAKARGK